MARQIAGDWQRLYAHPVYLLETFIDPERFRGILLSRGQLGNVGTHDRPRAKTTSPTKRIVRSKKFLALPVDRRFRELLSEVR